MKQRNPRFGCRRIAQQIAFAFGIDIGKDLVRRVLAQHYYPPPGAGGPSWLSFLGHAKDSLWSVDFFRCENEIIADCDSLPKSLSSDNDPLFRYHRWRANLRILDVTELKTVPYVPLSHPFVERLIGTVRRESLDQIPFWSARDLENKLNAFQNYYNARRVHFALNGQPPECAGSSERIEVAD